MGSFKKALKSAKKGKASKRLIKYLEDMSKKYPKGYPKPKELIIKPPSSGKSWDYLSQSTKFRKKQAYVPPKAKTAIKILKPAKKSVARKIAGKVVGKAIPGVGAAIVAKDVIKGVSKATCSRRGGKWVSGKCVGTTKSIFGKKHTKFKKGAQVRDPISKR